MTNLITSDRERWDALADEKGALRAAWDEDYDATMETVVHLLHHLPKQGVIYEIGCGPGRLALPVSVGRPEASVIGLDVSPGMLEGAPNGINLHCLLLADDTLPPTQFLTGAYSVLCFQHLHEETVASYISQVGKMLPNNGRFVFQYCEAAGDHFAMSLDWVERRLEEAELAAYNIVEGIVMDPWMWVAARKL